MAFSEYSLMSATIRGVTAVAVKVEVMLCDGIPSFSIVGMPDAAIIEARERVRSAIKACGFKMPIEKLIVNLAPGSLRKNGSGFDLPIALGILAASGQINPQSLHDKLIVGELSLDGNVRPVKGTLAFIECARNNSKQLLCSDKIQDFIDIAHVHAYGISSLRHARNATYKSLKQISIEKNSQGRDFKEIHGHEQAKRALQVAAAGAHGVLMMGPPGSGKSALASCIPSILPPLTHEERLEAARVRSVLGEDINDVLSGVRPFRSPHYTATVPGLLGGGTPIRPGELSLAHTGVLFLDEIAEFSPRALQSIRIPIEQGFVRIVRADGSVNFPSQFMLVAASNPCPCGYFGDDRTPCTCTQSQIHTYQNRIGGPLLDRIDMHIDIWRPSIDVLVDSQKEPISSAKLYRGVETARHFAQERTSYNKQHRRNESMKELMRQCKMDKSTKLFFEKMANSCALSGRGIEKILLIARTIADMAQSYEIQKQHVAESFSLRMHEHCLA